MFDALAIEKDPVSEKASTLAQTAERFEQSLSAFMHHLHHEQTVGRPAPPPREQRVLEDERRHLRDRARLCLWNLLTHREALGLNQHEPLLRHYGVPAEVRGALMERSHPAHPVPVRR